MAKIVALHLVLIRKEKAKTANKKRHCIGRRFRTWSRCVQLHFFLDFLKHAIKIALEVNFLPLRYFLIPERAFHP